MSTTRPKKERISRVFTKTVERIERWLNLDFYIDNTSHGSMRRIPYPRREDEL